MVVADASGRDPAVACTLGLCLALDRAPVLLVHDPGDLPAGLRSLASVAYDPVDPGQLQERLTAAILAPPPEDQSRHVALTKKGLLSKSIFGFGVVKLMLGGTTPCFKAKAAFISAASPAVCSRKAARASR